MNETGAGGRLAAAGEEFADGPSRLERLAAMVARAHASGRRAIDESSCKRMVAAYGIRVPEGRVVASAEELPMALAALRPPWVLKIVSPDVLHKTEAGAVRTGLADVDEVAAAMRSIGERMWRQGARVDGYLVEEMAPAGLEIVIGGVRDPSFGWLLMFGLGGILVEYLQDVAFRICPITRLDAAEMIGEIKTHPLLEGVRGRAGIDATALVDALLAIGGENGLLAEAGKDVAEIDLNPLLASNQGIVAVDARIVLAHE
jgi:acetate---CoA ligase (ADP-forming) subunit beta